MDYQVAILLYSNYSNYSKQLLTNLNTVPLDMLKLQTICVDNEHVRKRILKSKTINITTIPALLLVYNNGGVEKYDGQNVFSLIEALIQKYLPPPPPPPEPQLPPPPQPEPEPQAKAQQAKAQQAKAQQAKAQAKAKPKKKVVLQPSPPDPQVLETTLEDLDSEEEDEHYIERPPAMMRNGPGGYDIDTDFSHEEDDRQKLENHMSKSSNKGASLMAAAMAMQNERD